MRKTHGSRISLGVIVGGLGSALAIGLVLAIVLTGRSPDRVGLPVVRVTPTATASTTPDVPEDAGVLVGAGDIAGCDFTGDDATADLLDSIPGVVFTLGDNVYPRASQTRFAECFGPTWGRHLDRIRPVMGTRDAGDAGASSYFTYFGPAAGERGYYTYDIGSWRVYALNSVCDVAEGCGPGSEQYEWLATDLARRPSHCTIAYWHHPPSAMRPGSDLRDPDPLFQLLYDAGAQIVMAGGAHNYQRFARLAPDGSTDPDAGIRLFIVGTGGAPLDALSTRQRPTVEASSDAVHGVLKLSLGEGTYDWEFVSTDGSFSDAGSDTCAPPEG